MGILDYYEPGYNEFFSSRSLPCISEGRELLLLRRK